MAEAGAALDRDVIDFEFRQLCRVRIHSSPSSLPTTRCQLLAISSRFGLTFVAVDKELKVLRTSDFLRKDEEHATERIKYIVEDFPVLVSVVLEEEISMIVLSCDSLTLAISTVNLASGIYFLDTRCLATQGPKKPFMRCPLSCPAGSLLQDMVWNPVVPTLLVVCTSAGNVDLLEVTDRATIKGNVPPSSGSCCVCWSPKGKQLVVGRQDGTLVQYDQNLVENRKWNLPNVLPESAYKVLDIHWLTNYQFLVAYIPPNAEPDIHPTVILINGSKDAPPTNDNFDDVCYGTGDKRQRKYFMIAIQNWDVLLLASSNAAEIGVIGKHLADKQKWDHWYFEDSARAECPVTEDCNDSYPKGLAVDFTSQKEIPIGDNKAHPPSPILIVLTTDGLLIPYHMIYSHPEAPRITVLPEQLQPAGVRTGQAALAGQTIGSVQPSAAKIAFGGGLQNFGASSVAGTSATNISKPPFGTGQTVFSSTPAATTASTSGTAKPIFGTGQPSSINMSTTTSGTTQQPFIQPFSNGFNFSTSASGGSGTTMTKVPVFGTASTDSSPFNFASPTNAQGFNFTSQTNAQGFNFTSKAASSGAATAATALTSTTTSSATAASMGTFNFTSKLGTGQSFNFTASAATTKSQASAPTQGLTATTTNTASGVASPGTFSFISKLGSGQGSGSGFTGTLATTKSSSSTPMPSVGTTFQGSASVFGGKTITPVIPSTQGNSLPQGTQTNSFAQDVAGQSLQTLQPAAAFGSSGVGAAIGKPEIKPSGMEQQKIVNATGPGIFGNTGSVGTPPPATGFKFTTPAQAAAVPPTTKPAVTKSPTPVTLGQPIRTSSPVVSQRTASPVQTTQVTHSANNVISTLEARLSPQAPSLNNEINDQVDNHFTNSILEEIQQFQQELKQHKAKSRQSPAVVGTKAELIQLKKQTEDMRGFSSEIKDILKDQSKEMKDMKSECLDMFAMMEECRVREQRSSDPKYFQLLKSHALDPGSTDRMEKLQAQFQALDLGIQEVNLILDMQWEEYQNQKKKKSNRIQTPTSDAVYRALKSNRNILQAQKTRLAELEEQLKSLRIYNTTRSNIIVTPRPIRINKQNSGESELSSLADSLLYSDETSHSSVSHKSGLHPDKMARLREHLSRRSVPIVKSTKPENLSMSRILADERQLQTTRRNGQPSPASRESRSPLRQHVITPAVNSLKQEPGIMGNICAHQKIIMKPNESSGPPVNPIFSQGVPKQPRVMPALNKSPTGITGVIGQVEPKPLPVRPQIQGTQVITGVRELNGIQFEDITPPPEEEEEEEEEDEEEDEDSDDEEEEEEEEEEEQGFGPQYNMPNETKKITDSSSGKLRFGEKTFPDFASEADDGTKPKQTRAGATGFMFGQCPTSTFALTAPNPTTVGEEKSSKDKDANTSTGSGSISSGKKFSLGSESSFGGISATPTMVFGGISTTQTMVFGGISATPNMVFGAANTSAKTSATDSKSTTQGPVTTDTRKGDISTVTATDSMSTTHGPVTTDTRKGDNATVTATDSMSTTHGPVTTDTRKGDSSTVTATDSMSTTHGQVTTDTRKGDNATVTATDSKSTNGQVTTDTRKGDSATASAKPSHSGGTGFASGTGFSSANLFGKSSQADTTTVIASAQSSTQGGASTTSSSGPGVTRNLFGQSSAGAKLFGQPSPSVAISTAGTTVTSSAATTTPSVTSNDSVQSGGAPAGGNTSSTTTVGFGTFSLSTSSVAPLFGNPVFGQVSTTAASNPPSASMSIEDADQSTDNIAVSICNKTILSLLTEDENSQTLKQSGSGDSGQVATTTTTATTQGANVFGFKFGSTSGFGQPAFGQATTASQASSAKFGLTPTSTSATTTSSTTSTVFSQPNSVAPAGSTDSSTTGTTTTTLTNPASGSSTAITQPASGTTGSSVFGGNNVTGPFVQSSFGSISTNGSGFSFGSASTPSSGVGFGAANTNSGSSGFGLFGQSKSAFGGTAATATSSNSPFSQSSTNGGTGVFGQTSGSSPFGSSTATSSTGLFGQSGTSSSSPFGGTAISGNGGMGLFGQQSTSSSLFGSASSATSSGGFGFGQQQTGTSSGPFSFSSASTTSSSGGGGGMFGGGGLFSGLGGKPSEEKAKQNVFGSPQTFSGVTSQASVLFGNQGVKTLDSFGSPQTSSSFSGVAFSNQAGGGVGSTGFGVSQQQQTAGGFGSPPRFGGVPTFGSGTAFGSAPTFGSSPVFGSHNPSAFGGQSMFGNSPGISQGNTTGGFASFASSGSPTFGSLAQASDAPSFGGMPQSGGSGFGNAPSFGSPAFGSPGFGQSSTGFGSQGGSSFGGSSFGSGPSFTGYRS